MSGQGNTTPRGQGTIKRTVSLKRKASSESAPDAQSTLKKQQVDDSRSSPLSSRTAPFSGSAEVSDFSQSLRIKGDPLEILCELQTWGCSALGQYKNTGAVAANIVSLLSSETDAESARVALKALRFVLAMPAWHVEETVEWLIGFIGGGSRAVVKSQVPQFMGASQHADSPISFLSLHLHLLHCSRSLCSVRPRYAHRMVESCWKLVYHKDPRVRCEAVLSLTNICGSEAAVMSHRRRQLIHLLSSSLQDPSTVVRAAALTALYSMYERGVPLPISIYRVTVTCLRVREADPLVKVGCMLLLTALANLHPAFQLEYSEAINTSRVSPTSHTGRVSLCEDAFVHISSFSCDRDVRVRRTCARVLGLCKQMRSSYVAQALSKVVLAPSSSSSKRKRSSKGSKASRSGSVSSRNNNAATVAVASKPHTASGSQFQRSVSLAAKPDLDLTWSGAIAHGWEDEDAAVRINAIESACALARRFPEHAQRVGDLVVDMFSDDDTAVRCRALHSATQLSDLLQWDRRYLRASLHAVHDADESVRRACFHFLTTCRLSTSNDLSRVITELLGALKEVPTNRLGVFRCLAALGSIRGHAALCLSLLSTVLQVKGDCLAIESSRAVAGDSLLAKLVFVWSAATVSEEVAKQVAEGDVSQFRFCIDLYPDLFPLSENSPSPIASSTLQSNALTLSVSNPLRSGSTKQGTQGRFPFSDSLEEALKGLTQLFWYVSNDRLASPQLYHSSLSSLKDTLAQCTRFERCGKRNGVGGTAFFYEKYVEVLSLVLPFLSHSPADIVRATVFALDSARVVVQLCDELLARFVGLPPQTVYHLLQLRLVGIELSLIGLRLSSSAPLNRVRNDDFGKINGGEALRDNMAKRLRAYHKLHKLDSSPLEDPLPAVGVRGNEVLCGLMPTAIPHILPISPRLLSCGALSFPSCSLTSSSSPLEVHIISSRALTVHLEVDLTHLCNVSDIRIIARHSSSTSSFLVFAPPSSHFSPHRSNHCYTLSTWVEVCVFIFNSVCSVLFPLYPLRPYFLFEGVVRV